MRLYIKVLTVLSIFIPTLVAAQTPSLGQPSFKPSFKENPKTKLTLVPKNSPDSIRIMPFMNSLPPASGGARIKFFKDQANTDPAYYYNMPTVKPGKTSKILIATLDPHSPFNDNMPVRKIEIVKP